MSTHRDGERSTGVRIAPQIINVGRPMKASCFFPHVVRRRQQSRQRQAIGRACCEALEARLLLSLTPAVNYQVGTNPLAVATADFNNDGKLDVATVNSGGISVLLGNGAGGFGAAIGAPVGYFANPGDFLASLTVADFNKDGNLDVAMAYYGVFGVDAWGSVGVALGNGQGGFAWVPQQFGMGYAVPHSVVVGDFNNDGNSDLVVFGEYDSFGLYGQWFGNGRGGFTAYGAVQLSLPYYGQAAGDLNGDGYLDVVGADGIELRNDGNGRLQPGSFGSSESYPLAAAIADFSSDGVPDLVVTGGLGWSPNGVGTVIGLGDGTFELPVAQPANSGVHTGVAVADFNGDGKLDVVTSDADTGTVSLLLGNGDGTLRYIGAFAVGPSPSAVAVGDFNGDGRPDVAAANGGSNNVSILLNDGAWPASIPGDANNDGRVDAFDLNLLAANWQKEEGVTRSNGDFTGDGKVNAFDLNILASHWQQGVSPTAALTEIPLFGVAVTPEAPALPTASAIKGKSTKESQGTNRAGDKRLSPQKCRGIATRGYDALPTRRAQDLIQPSSQETQLAVTPSTHPILPGHGRAAGRE